MFRKIARQYDELPSFLTDLESDAIAENRTASMRTASNKIDPTSVVLEGRDSVPFSRSVTAQLVDHGKGVYQHPSTGAIWMVDGEMLVRAQDDDDDMVRGYLQAKGLKPLSFGGAKVAMSKTAQQTYSNGQQVNYNGKSGTIDSSTIDPTTGKPKYVVKYQDMTTAPADQDELNSGKPRTAQEQGGTINIRLVSTDENDGNFHQEWLINGVSYESDSEWGSIEVSGPNGLISDVEPGSQDGDAYNAIVLAIHGVGGPTEDNEQHTWDRKEFDNALQQGGYSDNSEPRTAQYDMSGSGGDSMTNEELAEELNQKSAFPDVNKGKVQILGIDEKPIDCPGTGYVDAHPEGADRGGYVPYWECNGAKAYYSSNEEWASV